MYSGVFSCKVLAFARAQTAAAQACSWFQSSSRKNWGEKRYCGFLLITLLPAASTNAHWCILVKFLLTLATNMEIVKFWPLQEHKQWQDRHVAGSKVVVGRTGGNKAERAVQFNAAGKGCSKLLSNAN